MFIHFVLFFPLLLNVENGTIDLWTGELLSHRQEDKITKMVNVRYDLSADCPKWKQFVRKIMNYKGDLNKQATGNDQLTARWLKT